ncbi:hypothetical protein PMH09_13625 [Roseofilum sp. BLCC_M143]|uniref:Uncharacterized protein n=1 Tax=Roseofilum casamattae BLCC-M143 TaxID=3022442 RepID=A0ABT7BYR9_9CYAN|nr:hypothetical protein [Roseofilum casamattae BLCC-M143]
MACLLPTCHPSLTNWAIARVYTIYNTGGPSTQRSVAHPYHFMKLWLKEFSDPQPQAIRAMLGMDRTQLEENTLGKP